MTNSEVIQNIKDIIEKNNLGENVKDIYFSYENTNIFYQKIFNVTFKNHDDKLEIVLNAPTKKEFNLLNYSKDIENQVLDSKYLFEEEFDKISKEQEYDEDLEI